MNTLLNQVRALHDRSAEAMGKQADGGYAGEIDFGKLAELSTDALDLLAKTAPQYDQLIEMHKSLAEIGRKLEVAGLLNLNLGDDYSKEAAKFLIEYAIKIATLHNPLVAALAQCLNFIEHSQANKGKLTTADDWKRNVEDFRANTAHVSIGRTAVPDAECNLQSVRALLMAANSI
jgi:hypothetical protein